MESPVFQQKELARDVNYELLKLERLRPDALIEVKDFIKFKIAMYDRRHGERHRNDASDFDPDEERRSGQERRKAVGSYRLSGAKMASPGKRMKNLAAR